MKKLTKKQMESLKAQASEIQEQISGGKSTREILAQIYVDNLDEKTMPQGLLMADAVLDNVKRFDEDYQEAQRDLDRYLCRFQDRVDDGETCAERCTYWLKFAAAVSAATADLGGEGADRGKTLEEIEAMAVPEEEATPAREEELKEQAREAIRNSGLLMGALTQQADALEEMASADEAAELLIDLGKCEIEYRAIVAMLAYTHIKTGEYGNLPAEMTARQVTAMACAAVEQEKILAAVGKGTLAERAAAWLLSALGIVVLTSLALKAVHFVGFLLLFGIEFIPLFLVIVAGMSLFIASVWTKWPKVSRETVRVVKNGVAAVVAGLRRMAQFVARRVIPAIAERAKGILHSARETADGKRTPEVRTEAIPVR